MKEEEISLAGACPEGFKTPERKYSEEFLVNYPSIITLDFQYFY
jgi:hypothetical protein